MWTTNVGALVLVGLAGYIYHDAVDEWREGHKGKAGFWFGCAAVLAAAGLALGIK